MGAHNLGELTVTRQAPVSHTHPRRKPHEPLTFDRPLGAGAGVQTARARRAGLSGSPVTFTTFSEINGAMTIAASGSANVTDTVLSTVPVAVTVTNHWGAAVSGVSVSWTVTGGGGSPSQASTMTNGNGVASVNWTLGSTAGCS